MACVLGLTATGCGAVDGTGDAWRFSTIDDTTRMTAWHWDCLRLDSKGDPHVVFHDDVEYGPDFFRARLRDGAWRALAIGQRCAPRRVRFAIDGKDTLHVLFSPGNSMVNGLTHACTEDKSWRWTTLYDKPTQAEKEEMRGGGSYPGTLNDRASGTSNMAVDENGGVHVVYVDPETALLTYGHRAPGEKRWQWETLENVGDHEVSVSRIFPYVAVSPSGQVWVTYKTYKEGRTSGGARTVDIKLRLAVKQGAQWKYESVVDGMGFIDGASKIIFGEGDRCAIAYAANVAEIDSTVRMAWPLLQRADGQWVERYSGEPREQLLAARWVDGRLRMLMTRVRPDRPDDGTMLQDFLVLLTARDDGKWATDYLLELHDRQAISGVIGNQGDLHVVFTRKQGKSTALEYATLPATALAD